jgi:hypothetical protein
MAAVIAMAVFLPDEIPHEKPFGMTSFKIGAFELALEAITGFLKVSHQQNAVIMKSEII